MKGLGHEDFTVLGQFCTKSLTYFLETSTKCSSKTIRKIACVAGGIVRVRGKILTLESEYGRRSREENGSRFGFAARIGGSAAIASSWPRTRANIPPATQAIRKISNEFYQGDLTIITTLVIYEDMASKLAKIGLKFQSTSILAIRSNRRQETVSVL